MHHVWRQLGCRTAWQVPHGDLHLQYKGSTKAVQQQQCQQYITCGGGWDAVPPGKCFMVIFTCSTAAAQWQYKGSTKAVQQQQCQEYIMCGGSWDAVPPSQHLMVIFTCSIKAVQRQCSSSYSTVHHM
jgi:hypothetical protein